jgi:hypothetical protein
MLIEAYSSLVLLKYREHSDRANCSGERVNETKCSVKSEQLLD